MPCGFSLDRTIQDIKLLAHNQRWNQLRAVQAGRAYAVDGNAYFNRPGPRLVDSAELMAKLLHPAVFDFPNFENAYNPIDPHITSYTPINVSAAKPIYSGQLSQFGRPFLDAQHNGDD